MITIIFNFLWMQQEELADIRGNNPQVFLCMVAVVITTREWFFFCFFNVVPEVLEKGEACLPLRPRKQWLQKFFSRYSLKATPSALLKNNIYKKA